MKAFLIIVAVSLLSACATPRPVVDTAALVAKMSSDMDRSVTNYVGSLKTVRKLDTERLQELQSDADKRRRPIQDRIQALELADEVQTLKALDTVAVAPEPDPKRVAFAVLPVASTPVAFDSAPLQAVASIAGDLAQPRSAEEQLKVLLTFAQTVNADLQKATDENNTPPKP